MPDLAPDHPWVLAAIVLGAIVQDDLTCIAVGVLVSAGRLPVGPSLLACFLGTLLGDWAWFFGARWIGRLASRALPSRWLRDSERARRAKDLLDRYGGLAIMASRFLPGLRTPVQVISGVGYRSAARACAYFVIAAAIYAPLLVGVSAAAGDQLRLRSLYEQYGAVGRLAVVACVLAVWLAIRLASRWMSRAHP